MAAHKGDVETQKQNGHLSLKGMLWRLFAYPSVVLVGGTWKTGKTDFSLWLSELLTTLLFSDLGHAQNSYSLVREVASNINTQGHYPQISDLISLRQWLYSSSRRKLYIFDEASEHLPNTRSMSAKSVGLKGIIPQVSKAHGRMIVVGHNLLRIDSTMLDATWCKGIFFKTGLKTASLISNLLPRPFELTNIPPTKVPFDPYDLAPFTEKPEGQVYFKDRDRQLLWEWSNGKTYEELGLHAMQINRLARKYIKASLESEPHASHS